MDTLDIGEVAAQSGVSASALRYYEQLGLIESVARKGLRRQFDRAVLLKLSLIALGKTAGFSLDEIAAMLGNGGLDIPRAQLHARADALAEQIRRMQALEQAIRHVAECPAPSHLQCPKFRQLLRHAGAFQKQNKTAGVSGRTG
ncbi:MerR family transcriptional regulator [Lysobacteraceae bacterium NML08-0793]|nr:MerR family transcriptional regulator [Xanthomonadaceae bacterium NML08-0793]